MRSELLMKNVRPAVSKYEILNTDPRKSDLIKQRQHASPALHMGACAGRRIVVLEHHVSGVADRERGLFKRHDGYTGDTGRPKYHNRVNTG